jgi:hypothetical protein
MPKPFSNSITGYLSLYLKNYLDGQNNTLLTYINKLFSIFL